MEVPGPRVIVRAELENGFGPTVSSSQPISSSSRYHRGETSSAELLDLDAAIDRGRQHLLHLQTPRGYWCAELEGDTILESEYILLLAWLDQLDRPEVTKAARYIAQQQRPEGGWALYPGGELDISSSVKAYFALKLTGYDPECEPMKRACQAIVARGGADCVNSFTRFYLALLGQISYEHCPAVIPEIVLLPNWSPVNIYRISSWSRAILVPLAIMWAHRPVRRLADSLGIEELFVLPPEKWPPLRSPGAEPSRGIFTWERFFRVLDRNFKRLERWHVRPLRRRALRTAEQWMLDRFVDSDGLGGIFPPIVWSIVALKCLGYSDDSMEVAYCHEQLQALMIKEKDTVRLQPCKSPVWDTSLSLRALGAVGCADGDSAVVAASRWLLEKEVRRPGDWSTHVKAEPGGWYFEYHNAFYPDLDDTAVVLATLHEHFLGHGGAMQNETRSAVAHTVVDGAENARDRALLLDQIIHACNRGRRWVLAMQNSDGGWGAFDRDNDREFLCKVPFADHNAMIDPSTPDLTGRVLEALAQWDVSCDDPAVDRAIQFLLRTQEEDGSWTGRWGVNYIYGTWQTVVGLVNVGVPTSNPAVQKAANWLLTHQQSCGGWGESPRTYDDPSLRGQGPVTPSQTAWAVMGLISCGLQQHAAVQRGVQFLIDQQREDGSWYEPEYTGTGFPRVFYLRYHMYPIYFPLMALGRMRSAVSDSREHDGDR